MSTDRERAKKMEKIAKQIEKELPRERAEALFVLALLMQRMGGEIIGLMAG